MKPGNAFPAGWDESRVRRTLAHYKGLAEAEAVAEDEAAWLAFSLSSAMRGMEDEPELYTAADLKEVFRRGEKDGSPPPPSR